MSPLTLLAAVGFVVLHHEFFEMAQQLHRLLPDKTRTTNTDLILAPGSYGEHALAKYHVINIVLSLFVHIIMAVVPPEVALCPVPL